ncbi:unnamed protein product, partial [Rotaria magnacalcarata]
SLLRPLKEPLKNSEEVDQSVELILLNCKLP